MYVSSDEGEADGELVGVWLGVALVLGVVVEDAQLESKETRIRAQTKIPKNFFIYYLLLSLLSLIIADYSAFYNFFETMF